MNVIAPWYYLGYVIPHAYTDLDAYQFYRVAPEGMVLVTTGLDLKEFSPSAVEELLGTAWRGFDILAKRGVDRIALSGVPVAATLGREKVLAVLQEASQRTGIPCDTDIEAHIAALQQLGADEIVLATRWAEPLNRAVVAYLQSAGIHVLAHEGAGRTFRELKAFDPMADHNLALELGSHLLAANPTAKALMMPGGLWFDIHAVPMLEAEFGKPVTLNITSTTWAALRALGDRAWPRSGDPWGKLLAAI